MSDFDHLLTFADEAAAIAALGRFRVVTDDGLAIWSAFIKGGATFGPIDLIRVEAVYDVAGAVISPAEIVPGYTRVITLPQPDTSLTLLGVPYLIADAEAAARGEPFIVAASYTPEQIAGIVKVEPIWAGRPYHFGN